MQQNETDRQTDVNALRAIIADVQRGFNDNDPELLVAHFAEDGTAVNVMGALLEGRESMLRFPAGSCWPAHSRMSELATTSGISPSSPRMSRSRTRRRARSTQSGADIDDRDTMIALYVFVRREDRWLIAARQNTLIAS